MHPQKHVASSHNLNYRFLSASPVLKIFYPRLLHYPDFFQVFKCLNFEEILLLREWWDKLTSNCMEMWFLTGQRNFAGSYLRLEPTSHSQKYFLPVAHLAGAMGSHVCWVLFSSGKLLLSGAFLQAKFRLALDVSDMYSAEYICTMSEPVQRKVYKLNPAVGTSLIAGKKTIPERPFPISWRRIKK